MTSTTPIPPPKEETRIDVESKPEAPAIPSTSSKTRENAKRPRWPWIGAFVPAIIVIVLVVALPLALTDEESDSPAKISGENVTTNNITKKPPEQWDCSTGLTNVTSVCQAAVSGIANLHRDLYIPDNLMPEEGGLAVRQDSDFNVSTYFEVLQHVRVADGNVLDYVYHFDGMGGFPSLHVRPEDDGPFKTSEEYAAHCRQDACSGYFLNDIINEDTPRGYMEVVVLDVMAEQFYLWWHAAFNDLQIVCDQSTLDEDIVSLVENEMSDWGEDVGPGAEFLELVSNSTIDLTPTVECVMTSDNREAALVRAVTFTKWGGLYRSSWTITSNSSHRQDDNLIPFEVAWVF